MVTKLITPKPFQSNYSQEELQASRAAVKFFLKDTHFQKETIPYIYNVCSLSGSDVPLRKIDPNDKGKTAVRKNYPNFDLPGRDEGMLASRIGYNLIRNRRTVFNVLCNLLENDYVLSFQSKGRGHGWLWIPTPKATSLVPMIKALYYDNGFCPMFEFDLRGFDRSGFDSYGVDYNGFNRDGEYVGINHIFQHYYDNSPRFDME